LHIGVARRKGLPDDEEKTATTRVMLETILAKMNEQGARLDALNTKVDELGVRVYSLDAKVDELGARVDRLDAKVDELGVRLDRLDAKVEGLSVKMEEGFDSIGHQLMVISGDLTRLRADAIRQAKRVDELEKKAS
jgi:outer membrane murein-binding lipoprotein Lpp